MSFQEMVGAVGTGPSGLKVGGGDGRVRGIEDERGRGGEVGGYRQ